MDKVRIRTFQSVVDIVKTTKTANNSKVKNSKEQLSGGKRTK